MKFRVTIETTHFTICEVEAKDEDEAMDLVMHHHGVTDLNVRDQFFGDKSKITAERT